MQALMKNSFKILELIFVFLLRSTFAEIKFSRSGLTEFFKVLQR